MVMLGHGDALLQPIEKPKEALIHVGDQ